MKTRSMVLSADMITGLSTSSGKESLVIEQWRRDNEKLRVTIELGSHGAEELAVKLSAMLRARRERAASLERYLATAVEESKR